MDNTKMAEIKYLNEEYFTAKGTYKEKLNAAYAKYQGFPIMNEVEFWRHMAYQVAESADAAIRAMKSGHEHMLAFKFELDKRQKEFGFEHKSPMEIDRQWEDHKKAVRAKLDEFKKQRDEE